MKLMFSKAYSVSSNAAEAEDACQEAFVRIIKYIDRIDDVTEMRTAALCAAVARNTAIDLYRKNAKMVPVGEVYGDTGQTGNAWTSGAAGRANRSASGVAGEYAEASDAVGGESGDSSGGDGIGTGTSGKSRGAPAGDEPYEKLEQKEAVARLAGLIGELPENYREVLRARCLSGLSAAQTAELLGITENTVNIRLTRARKLLKERLEGG